MTVRTNLLASLFSADVQRCQRCEQRLNGTVLKLDDGKHFHPRCFQYEVVRLLPVQPAGLSLF